MATRTLTVEIVGDPSSLNRAFKTIDTDADRSAKRMQKWGRIASASFTGIGIAGGAAVIGLKSVVSAAAEAEKSQARLETQLKAINTTYSAHAKQIESVIQRHSQLSGFDDEDLADSFTNIVRITEDVDKGLRLTGLAADFARAKHIDVAKAGELVGKVAGGNTGILSRYGIQIDKGATATEALGVLQRKFAGQAEAYGKTTSGAGDRIGVAWENVREELGEKLLPIVTRLGNKFADFLNEIVKNEGAGGRFRDTVEDVADKLGDVLEVGKDVAEWLKDHKELVKLAAGAWVAYKLAVLGAAAATRGAAFKTGLTGAAAGAGGAAAAGTAARGAAGGAAGAAAVGKIGGPAGILATVAGFTQLQAILRGYAKQDSGIKVFEADLKRLTSTRNQQGLIELADKVREYARVNNDLFSDTNKLEAFADQVEALGRKPVHATGRLKTSTDDLIRSVHRQIATTEDQINELAKHGSASGKTGEKVDRLREKQERLRKELARLQSKSIDVRVRLDFNTAINASPGGDAAQGDGWGGPSLTSRVRAGVKANASKLFFSSFGGPLTGAFGGMAGLMGARPQLGPFAALGSRFGLGVSSGLRPGAITASGNPSWHSSGEALDVSGSKGGMLAYAKAIASMFGGRLAELIHTPLGFSISHGQRVAPYAQADHYDHVHVAMDTGRPGIGDGIGDAARSAKKYWRGNDQITAVAVAGPESGYRDRARLVTGAEDSRGMWQVNTYAHPWARGLNMADTDTAARAAHRVWREAGGSWGPWSGYTSGGYRAFVSRARAAVAALGGGGRGAGGGSSGSAGLIGSSGPGMVGLGSGNMGKAKPIGMNLPGGLDPGSGVTDQPSGSDYIDRDIALAALTAGTEDDVAAARAAVAFWEKKLADAGLTSDPRDDTAAAGGLRAARESLDALTNATEEANRLAEQRAAVVAEQVENQRKILALAQQGPGILAAVIAAVNGDIGARTGLSYQTVGVPGATARY